MFNCYAVRPIGSKKFEEHLKNLETISYYENVEDKKEAKVKNIHGTIPWKETKRVNGYESLVVAIIANAILDYLYWYKEKVKREEEEGRDGYYWLCNSRCIEMENRYFRRNPYLEEIFNKLLSEICWEGIDTINSCIERLKKTLRWSKTNNR